MRYQVTFADRTAIHVDAHHYTPVPNSKSVNFYDSDDTLQGSYYEVTRVEILNEKSQSRGRLQDQIDQNIKWRIGSSYPATSSGAMNDALALLLYRRDIIRISLDGLDTAAKHLIQECVAYANEAREMYDRFNKDALELQTVLDRLNVVDDQNTYYREDRGHTSDEFTKKLLKYADKVQ